LQIPFAVNAVCHLWGTRPYDTGDLSRNNFLLGLVALWEGWHNNHHAFPSSARHGFYWWQPDLTWCVIWLMERVGLAWRVKWPDLLSLNHCTASSWSRGTRRTTGEEASGGSTA
jgi:stearoyl-CoA desaturase (Delta-9 desaturase)